MFLFGFFTLQFIDDSVTANDPYPLIGKIAIFMIPIGIIGMIVEIIRLNKNKKNV